MDSEDVKQAVMERLARSMPRFRYAACRGRFRDYIGTIVLREIIRFQSRSYNCLTAPFDNERFSESRRAPDTRVDDTWETEWADHHLRLAMDHIRDTCSPKSISIFSHLLDGHDIESAARRFGMSIDSIHKVKQRLKKRLRDRIAFQVRSEEAGDEIAKLTE